MKAQISFDPGEGCLNVVDIAAGPGLGENGASVISVNYLHERFINEQFCVGAGAGYSHHGPYSFSAVPVYLSTHYFFLDNRFSPFVNLRAGLFWMFGARNLDTYQEYSLSGRQSGSRLFVSPGAGIKVHITPYIGIMASASYDGYLADAFDSTRNDYRTKMISNFGASIGICFQIPGW